MKKALFLDRDGVINIDHGYISQSDDFDFVPGIFALVKRFKQAGYMIIVVTNQSGIARGYYTEADFAKLCDWMKIQFQRQGASIDDIYFCPHHPLKGQGQYLQNCACRKPQPGMLLRAAQQHDIDLSQSVMVGDKVSDMQAAHRAGLNQCYFFSADKQPVEALPQGVKSVTALQQIHPG